MLIICFSNINIKDFCTKYPDKVCMLDKFVFKDSNGLISYIEEIKNSISTYDIVFINYVNEVVICLDTLSVPFTLLYPAETCKEMINGKEDEFQIFKKLALNKDSIVLDSNTTLEAYFKNIYNWVIEQPDSKEKSISDVNDKAVLNKIDRKNLTLQELIEQDADITEEDVRDMKSITNKFKVAMILQAKSRLSTVLKFCNILDKLYNELVDRIDLSIKTTDTASLMYTADYISKALSETNQFIMSMITNEKIQNFFVIDNSSIININDNKIDIDKREKIRKATEMILDNTDYFVHGEFDKIKNPNIIFEENEEENNVSTTT